MRWALDGRGKRGGARVIYYFHNEHVPLFALDIYAKNEKADLKPTEMDRLKRVVETIENRVSRKVPKQ